METALEKLLAHLPEYGGSLEGLRRGAEYFSVEPSCIEAAARALPDHHALSFQGVRLLLAACLEEFAAMFTEGEGPVCEVSVPAPVCAVYALQEAGGVTFRSSALFAQTVLRGIFLHRTPLAPDSCAIKRCGLNQMRRQLLERPAGDPIRFQLQFGALCDECGKAGEPASGEARAFTLTAPKTLPAEDPWMRALAARFIEQVCRGMDLHPSSGDLHRAMAQYSRLIRAERALCRLTARGDRLPLWGNSFSLAQSVQLMCPARPDRLLSALERLVEELEDAPAAPGGARVYCFYIPFLRPEIQRRFRENGVALMGNAAFLEGAPRPGFDLPGMITGWLSSMGLRRDTPLQCAAIAEAASAWGCAGYVTGSFAFDRWLGAAIPLQRRILRERYGIPSFFLEADFWCEHPSGSPESRIDALCALILQEAAGRKPQGGTGSLEISGERR